MKNLLLLLFCSLLFTSCKKELDHTYIEGTLKDYYSGQPLANLKVVLYGLSDANQNQGPAYTPVAQTVYTDANGHFKFDDFRAYRESRPYEVKLETSPYEMLPDIIKIETGEKNNLMPVVVKVCNLNFNFINVTPFDNNDKICLTQDDSEEKILHPNTSGIHTPSCWIGMQNLLNGGGPEESANITFRYSWEVTKNNSTQSFQSSFVIKNDTTISINY